jgi:hypothetical protein
MRANFPQIMVSSNGRFLNAQGTPFFWLADTAWELFHRLNREDAAHYFAVRARQRFNVVQAVALAEFNGLTEPNAYGEVPLIERDPARPNDAYFKHVDDCIALAAEHGIYVALLPTWGDKVARGLWANENVIFDAANARVYGRWIGERYKNASNVLWMIGGDRPPVYENHDERPIWRAMAEGIREHVPQAFMTYHTKGGESSGMHLHDEAWLNMNAMQSGHGGGRDVPVWDMIAADYARTPAKPTLDSEPNYEDHPVNPWPKWEPAYGFFRDYDVRKQSYRSVFAGGCGVTYGHHSMWQFCSTRFERVNHAECYWTEAITRPGAEQMRYLRELMESLPYFERIPDQLLLIDAPADRGQYAAATRDVPGNYVLVYVPNAGQTVTLTLNALRSTRAAASWFDPRTGDLLRIGDVDTRKSQAFTTPMRGPDWVLHIVSS